MIQALQTLGLNEKQAKVYMATLALGTSSVKNISTKCELKRPTVYVYLEEMLKSGFIHKITIGKKEYYQALSPKAVENKLEENVSSFKKQIHELEILQQSEQGRPGVQVFEGEKGLFHIYEEMKKTRELIFWSDLSSVEKIFPDAYRKINQATIDNKIFTREILADTPDARASAKRWAVTAGENYSARLASGPVFNDSVIYDNVVCFFRLQEFNLFVVRIEDVTIATTMKTMFEMAWRSAKAFIPK
ncbi:MAG: helix-turn-helix domain-containing protein [Candidatus Pacebacteria bacterium]|nr:helix-turn-helix domain-containing protein [Candidatus Paceibacterota bacterium]MDD5356786.1 helix-turn-helix domain-containing protein [Candidatus Paceibacterota bacterium]